MTWYTLCSTPVMKAHLVGNNNPPPIVGELPVVRLYLNFTIIIISYIISLYCRWTPCSRIPLNFHSWCWRKLAHMSQRLENVIVDRSIQELLLWKKNSKRKARSHCIVRLWDEKWVAAEMTSLLKRLTDIALDLGDNFIIRCGCSWIRKYWKDINLSQ